MSSAEAWSGQANWEQSLGGLRNSVRQELVTRQLTEYLPGPGEDVSVLDVGCGQGTQVLRLARQGYSILGLDVSDDSLALLRDRLHNEDDEVRERVALTVGSIHNLGSVLDRKYEVVLCHGVVMYMPTLQRSLEELAEAVAPSGILYVLTRNRFSIAMRAGMKGNYAEALDSFAATHYTNGLDVEDVRGDEPQEIVGELDRLGFDILGWYGVRLFTDHIADDSTIPDNFIELVNAEEEAGKRDPYRQLCSLIHVVGKLK